MASSLDDEWLSVSNINNSNGTGLSWATRISRTRVSTVDGLSFADSVDHGTVQSLEGVLQAVQKLRIERIPFEEIEEIRQVGHGETFQVAQCRLKGGVVAVKHVKLTDTGTSDSQRPFRRRLQSVTKEVSIMHHPPLRSHPNIMDLLGYGWRFQEGQPAPYVVVEYGTQGSLRQFLASSPQTLRAKMVLGGDVACGLMALHSCGIVHGDLKLDNVVSFTSLDRPSGNVAKLCDFGHSILLGDESQRELRYYGTTLYNAPEVSSQASAPIAREDLHRCDIWAFGLLLWEILLDGSRFFRKEWRRDPKYLRSLDTTYSSSVRDAPSSSSRPNNSTLLSDDAENDEVFGRFEPANLHVLAKQYVNSIQARNAEFEKGYLRALFERTLQSNPQSRISDLTKSPIISRHWNKSAGATALQAKMAIHTGSSGFSYDVFLRGKSHHIIWAHETQILNDLEVLCASSRLTDTIQSASFQAALCFINAFGCSRDDRKAAQYLRKAEEQGHLMAPLVWSRLSGVIAQFPSDRDESYTTFIKRGFLLERYFPPSKSLRVAWSPKPGVPSQYIVYKDYQEFTQTVQFCNDFAAAVVIVDHATPGLTMNILEAAVAFRDLFLAYRVIRYFDLFQKSCWNETPLQQAARHGDPAILSLFLSEANRTGHTVQDYEDAGILHWLFCLPDLSSIKMVLQLSSITAARLDVLQPISFRLHPQWPVKLEGTLLAVAVLVGDERLVRILLDQGANPLSAAFTKDVGGEIWTPLHLAVCYHQAKIFELMWVCVKSLTEEANALLQRFPLPCALSYSTTAERLVIHGTSCDTALRTVLSLPLGPFSSHSLLGRTALLQAIDFEDYEVVSALLDHHSDLAGMPFRDPGTANSFTYPLHFAAQVGSQRDTDAAINIVKRILYAKPEVLVNQQDDGSTALHMAATGESSRVVQYLLGEGADTAILDHKGRSVLHRCCSANNVSMLLDHGASIEMGTPLTGTALHAMAHAGLIEPARELLQRGAFVNAYCDAFASVLHAAVRGKSSDMVDLLIGAGADIDSSSKGNRVSVLMVAVDLRLSKIAWSLLNAGADCLTPDKNGKTAMQRSLQSGALPLINKMLSLRLNDLSIHSWTVMIHDVVRERPKTVLQELLRASEADQLNTPFDIDARLDGLTPLQVAASLLRTDVIELLLAHGADVCARDEDGNSPILLACKAAPQILYGSTRSTAVMLLLRHGAELLDLNNHMDNCLSIAQLMHDFELMTVLLGAAMNKIGLGSTGENHVSGIKANANLLILCEHAQAIEHYFAPAILRGEWDFVTICIAQELVEESVLIRHFIHDSRTYILQSYLADLHFDIESTTVQQAELQLLRAYARRGDRNMIQWATGGSRRSDLMEGVYSSDYERLTEWADSFHVQLMAGQFKDWTLSEPEDLDLVRRRHSAQPLGRREDMTGKQSHYQRLRDVLKGRGKGV